MNKFKTIVERELTAEVVEKRSKFIANIFSVDSVEKAEEQIKFIKKKYCDAKHNCFAYIINRDNEITKKSSDDGEPSGTAGAPMLEILDKQGLGNILVVVTRYFGGILLGTGGLVRAYSEALKKALEDATYTYLEHGYEIDITVNYSDFENFRYYCAKNYIKIVECRYADNVICRIELNDQKKDALEFMNNEHNNLNIKKFDIVRQKNIASLSDNVTRKALK